jgi:hypothetical protein
MQAQHYDARSHAAEYPSTQEKNVFCVLYVAKTTYIQKVLNLHVAEHEKCQ